MHQDTNAEQLAAILNAAYRVRHYSRPHQLAARDRATAELADAARAALARRDNDRAVLYAIAEGLRP